MRPERSSPTSGQAPSAETRTDRSTFACTLERISDHRQDLQTAKNATLRLADPPDILWTAIGLRSFDSGGILTTDLLVEAINIDRQALGFCRLVWADAVVWVEHRLPGWPRIVAQNEFSGFLDSALARGLAQGDPLAGAVMSSLLGTDSPLGLPRLVHRPPANLADRSDLVLRTIDLDRLVISRVLESLAFLVSRTVTPAPKPSKPTRPSVPVRDPLRPQSFGGSLVSPNPDPLIHRWAGNASGERQGGKVPPLVQEDQNSSPESNVT